MLVLSAFRSLFVKKEKVIYVHRLLLALTKQQTEKRCASPRRAGREQQRYSQHSKTGLMRNAEWHQPPRFYHSNCQKEERTLAGTSLLPTHTEAHASEARLDASQARVFTMISRQTVVLRTSDISPEGPLHPPAPAVPHLLLGLVAAAICSSRVVLRRWRTALALPAFLINSKRAECSTLLQDAGCL